MVKALRAALAAALLAGAAASQGQGGPSAALGAFAAPALGGAGGLLPSVGLEGALAAGDVLLLLSLDAGSGWGNFACAGLAGRQPPGWGAPALDACAGYAWSQRAPMGLLRARWPLAGGSPRLEASLALVGYATALPATAVRVGLALRWP